MCPQNVSTFVLHAQYTKRLRNFCCYLIVLLTSVSNRMHEQYKQQWFYDLAQLWCVHAFQALEELCLTNGWASPQYQVVTTLHDGLPVYACRVRIFSVASVLCRGRWQCETQEMKMQERKFCCRMSCLRLSAERTSLVPKWLNCWTVWTVMQN